VIGGNEVSGARERALRVSFPAHSQEEKTPMASVLETDLADPDHHLWRNGRLWWVAFTVHLPGWQKERVRLSLGTADVVEARRRRDALLARYPQTRACTLSLRLQPRRRMAVATAA
jgi:hypothetical protein